MRNLVMSGLLLLPLALLSPRVAEAQSAPQATPPTEISADLGSCSALITVTDANSRPIYAAKVATRIHYGMMGVKRLDLEAATSPNGQVKITSLPESLKKPMFIIISKDDREKTVEFKPELRCHATFDVQLR
jgi:ABC-type Fe3+-hydroxamate transport system substrate-binding protein